MSWQAKFLLIFAVIVLGTVLYLRRRPAMELAASLAARPAAEAVESRQSSDPAQLEAGVWAAIAPCWNRLASRSTIPVKLTLSFDTKGELAAPPEIERDPNAQITDQSLQSEALALQAVAECAPYPIVRAEQNLQIVFPATTTKLPAK